MGIFNLSTKPAINDGISEYQKIQGAILLDVRTRQEYADGHIPESRNLPLDELEIIEEEIPDKDTPIFVYCHSGARSSQAAAILEHLGYHYVKNIGGFVNYQGKVEK